MEIWGLHNLYSAAWRYGAYITFVVPMEIWGLHNLCSAVWRYGAYITFVVLYGDMGPT